MNNDNHGRNAQVLFDMNRLSYNTSKLLLNVSKQLSGRSKYRYTQFWLIIADSKSFQTIQLVPNIEVYPDIHRRRSSDRILLTDKAAQEFLSDSKVSSTYYTSCDSNTFVPGTYVFKQSIKNKKRRWFKV